MAAAEEASHWLPRRGDICFLDHQSEMLILLSRKVHQPPGCNVIWHGTVLPAQNTLLKGTSDLQGKSWQPRWYWGLWPVVRGTSLGRESPRPCSFLPLIYFLQFICDTETKSLSKLGWVMAPHVTTEYELTHSLTSASKVSDHSK